MAERKKVSNINDEFDFKLFMHIARKNVIWLFLFLGISSTIAFFYLRYTPAIYESGATIKLSTENKASEILRSEEHTSELHSQR